MKDLEWSASICYVSQPRSPQGGELSVVLWCLIFCGRDENSKTEKSTSSQWLLATWMEWQSCPRPKTVHCLAPLEALSLCTNNQSKNLENIADHFKMSSQVFRKTTTVQVSSCSKSHLDPRILLNWKPSERRFHVTVQSSAVRGNLYFYIETQLLDSSGSTFHSTFYTKFWRMVKIKYLGLL